MIATSLKLIVTTYWSIKPMLGGSSLAKLLINVMFYAIFSRKTKIFIKPHVIQMTIMTISL